MVCLFDKTNGKLKETRKLFADSPLLQSLEDNLDYLRTYGPHDGKDTYCELFPDFAPHSFAFVIHRRKPDGSGYERWFNGGLIFHGPADGFGSGSAPTFSTCVNATYGWSVHT